ncbi:MAG: hypothetical protein ACSI46_24620 [Gloeotrichia echinulata DVL01]
MKTGIGDWGFGIRDSGLGIGDSGFGIRDSGLGVVLCQDKNDGL